MYPSAGSLEHGFRQSHEERKVPQRRPDIRHRCTRCRAEDVFELDCPGDVCDAICDRCLELLEPEWADATDAPYEEWTPNRDEKLRRIVLMPPSRRALPREPAIAPLSGNQVSGPVLCRHNNLDGHPIVRRLAAERIQALYHFTSVENLPLIVATGGLLSKHALQRHHIAPPAPGGNEVSRDLDRRNDNWDFVSLSFTPHIPMAYYKKRDSHLCYFVLHPHVAALPGVMFTDRNATDHTHRRGGDVTGLNLIDFTVVRYEHAPDRADWKPLVQAEVLVPARVDLGCVAYVGFVSEASRDEAVRLMAHIPEDARRPSLLVAPSVFAGDPRIPASLRLPRLETVRASCSISDKVTLEARVISEE